MADEDDEGGFGGLYENGHWVWDESEERLSFKSVLPPKPVETVQILTKAPLGTVEFRDDVDLIEQIRFRRRYQRKLKPDQADVVTIQDVKDLAIYTAPLSLLTKDLIDILHLATTERFLRGLVLYCQYYIQTAEEMSKRRLELETKIRTAKSKILENVYRDDLSDLRLLIAKDYSTLLLGGADTKKYHHMGLTKKKKSLSDKDARLIESLIRMSVQVIWLCLGRQSFNKIELEVNRLFKSEAFNSVEHKLHTGYLTQMTKDEKSVLLGNCIRYDKKIYSRSPIMNEVFCSRRMDYRMFGLGVIKYSRLTPRFLYMYRAIAGPEEELSKDGVTVGILGMSRAKFDTTLHCIAITDDSAKPSSTISGSSRSIKTTSTKSSIKSKIGSNLQVYPDIYLPPTEPLEMTSSTENLFNTQISRRLPPPHTERKVTTKLIVDESSISDKITIDGILRACFTTSDKSLPPSFPDQYDNVGHCNEAQRRRWQNRLEKLMNPHK